MKTKEPPFRYSHVMLIDDNELDNFINSKVLEAHRFGRKIYMTTSGRSALEFLNNLLVVGEAFPQVLFVDINMPIMDGFQFLEKFRTISGKLGNPRIAVLTSSMSDDDRARAASIAPGCEFIHKPLTSAALSRL
jgi:CheY-like chemotaxis protein